MEGQRRVLGTPVAFEYDGKSFQIPPWEFEVEGLFAAWVEARAERRLKAKRKLYGEDEYRAQMRELRQDIDRGLYEWGSPIVVGAWSAPSGSKHLVWLTLNRLDSTVTPAWVERLAADREAWSDLWESLLLLNFPNADLPTETGSGNPSADGETIGTAPATNTTP